MALSTVRLIQIPTAVAGPVLAQSASHFERGVARKIQTNPTTAAGGAVLAQPWHEYEALLGPLQEPAVLTGPFDLNTELGVDWAIDAGGSNRVISFTGNGHVVHISNIGAGGSLLIPFPDGGGGTINQRVRPGRGGRLRWSVANSAFRLMWEG